MKYPNFDTLEKKSGQALLEALSPSVRKATAYVSPTFVITATRRHKPDGRAKSVELVVKIGKPNFRERQFIALCKKAGMAFPLRQIQLKHWTDGKVVRPRRRR